MNFNFKLLSALLAGQGFQFNNAFAFEFVSATSAKDSPLTQVRFMYRYDKKEAAEQVTIQLAVHDDSVVPPYLRGQRN